jgi:hypothetical protein
MRSIKRGANPAAERLIDHTLASAGAGAFTSLRDMSLRRSDLTVALASAGALAWAGAYRHTTIRPCTLQRTRASSGLRPVCGSRAPSLVQQPSGSHDITVTGGL